MRSLTVTEDQTTRRMQTVWQLNQRVVQKGQVRILSDRGCYRRIDGTNADRDPKSYIR